MSLIYLFFAYITAQFMPLINFTFVSPILEPERIGKAMASIIPLSVMNQAIRETKSEQKRERLLPTPIIILLVIGLNFWSADSVVDVLKNLTQGLMSELIPQKIRLKIPSSGSITEARQRVGAGVMTRLFHLICIIRATKKTPGAFLNSLRLMSLDGSLFDVPDTSNNARVFGYPGSRPGTRAAFPKARLVLLIESGTHLIIDALVSPYKMGERRRALKLLRSVSRGMLLMWDRGLHSYRMVDCALKRKAHILGRVPANVKFEVLKTFDDGSYLSWLAPDRKSKKKGATRIKVRVIEYVIEVDGEEIIYRLITEKHGH
ncbi:MAG: transposase domain-containing protein [Xenococcus sp. (in: cyanobacteria)]